MQALMHCCWLGIPCWSWISVERRLGRLLLLRMSVAICRCCVCEWKWASVVEVSLLLVLLVLVLDVPMFDAMPSDQRRSGKRWETMGWWYKGKG